MTYFYDMPQCDVLMFIHCLPLTTAAVHSSQTEVGVGEAAASHHPVLPDCDCCVRGSVPGVRLQTSLERCARWPPAGGFGGYSHSKS